MNVKNLIIIGMCFLTLSSFGSNHTKGYTKKDGTTVRPHEKTAPDKSKSNNYSSKGNTNPHTGKKGTVDPNKK